MVCYDGISCTNIALMQITFGPRVLSSSIHDLQKFVILKCIFYTTVRTLNGFLALLKYEMVQEQSCMTICPKWFRAAFCTCLLLVLLFGFLKTKENWTQNLTSQQVSSEASLPLLGKNVSEHSAPCKEQQLDRANPKED